MTTQQNTTPDTLADALAAALGEPGPAGQRLAIALYRLLAAGRPVAAADLAAATGLPEPAVAETLGSWPAVFTDSQGRITGFWGLAISELSPAHRYESGAKVLYAWCAWDTLFLPARLGQAARDLRLPGHRRADHAHRHPGGRYRDLPPRGGRVVPPARPALRLRRDRELLPL